MKTLQVCMIICHHGIVRTPLKSDQGIIKEEQKLDINKVLGTFKPRLHGPVFSASDSGHARTGICSYTLL